MSYGDGRTYKKIEVIGISPNGIEGAIQQAIGKAGKSVEGLSWFEVQEIRGHIGADAKISEFQVVLKISFELKA